MSFSNFKQYLENFISKNNLRFYNLTAQADPDFWKSVHILVQKWIWLLERARDLPKHTWLHAKQVLKSFLHFQVGSRTPLPTGTAPVTPYLWLQIKVEKSLEYTSFICPPSECPNNLWIYSLENRVVVKMVDPVLYEFPTELAVKFRPCK